MPLFGKRKDEPDDCMVRGRRYLAEGMYEKAREEFRRGLAASPHHNELRYLLGLVSLKEGKTKEAEEAFRETLRANPHHKEAHEQLALMMAPKASKGTVTGAPKKGALMSGGLPHFRGTSWEDVSEQYGDYFLHVKKEEGEERFALLMLLSEFAFKFERRKEDAPVFFFFTETHRQKLSGEVFMLLLDWVRSLPRSAKEVREPLLSQGDWIARNLGDDTHIARLEKIVWE